jgi:light-regulated signal transduction histidine kinase (bacteriophytochrome)
VSASDTLQHRLAELRHDLANLLNHVFGFTELLVQGARERGASEQTQAALEELTRAGFEIRRHLDEQLGTARLPIWEPDLQSLRNGITQCTAQIFAQVEVLRPLLDGHWEEAPGDLEEVRHAATRLQQMVAPGALERALQGPGKERRA